MSRPCIHLIANAHIDPVWQWRWEEGCAEALATFRTAVELLDAHPEFIFNHNEALLYRWVRELDPPLFEEIRRLVRAGRWHIAGGWHLQPDVNLPGAESIIRQIAEGRRFFREEFGAAPCVAYNFDSFGHSAGLPQILAAAGYAMYIHMRPQAPELDLPADLYRWEGADGTTILGLRIAVGLYHTEYDNLQARLEEGAAMALRLRRDVPVFWGIGNHGGGATREDLALIRRAAAAETRVRFLHSTPERLHAALAEAGARAPIVRGGLQRVFTGCYTSLARIKRGCASSLARLVQAETLGAMAWWRGAADYPGDALAAAWRKHLFNDFHDILPGTCIRPAEEDALALYGSAELDARRATLEAAVACNRGAAVRAYVPVTVLHTHPQPAEVPVELEFMLCPRPKWTGVWRAELRTLDGRPIACQEEEPEALLPFNGWRRKLCFMSPRRGIGAAHAAIDAVEGAADRPAAPPMLEFAFDQALGRVSRLAAAGRDNLLAAPCPEFLVVEDTGDSWGTEVRRYRDVAGRFELEPGSVGRIAAGPIRTIHEAAFRFGRSRICAQTIGWARWPVLEFRLRVLWNEERKRLKLALPTACAGDRVLCEILGGAAELPADGDEHAHARWCLLANGGAALGAVSCGLHGFDCLDGELRLSVLRSAAYCHERRFELGAVPARAYMDQGAHDVRLLVTAGTPEEVRARLPGLADYLHAPPVAYAHLPIGERGAARDGAPAFLTLAPAHVRLLACKRSADGAALIVRLQEGAGLPCTAALELDPPGLALTLPLRPLQIATLRIERSGAWRPVAMIAEE